MHVNKTVSPVVVYVFAPKRIPAGFVDIVYVNGGANMLIQTTPRIRDKKITKYLGLVRFSGTAVVCEEDG